MARHPREINPAVPEELDALVVKLLAKDPDDRYASAASLAEDLRRVRDGLPPLTAGSGDATTAQVPHDTGKIRRVSTAHRYESRAPDPPASVGRRPALVLPLALLLPGMALLGGLTWALGLGTSNQGTPEEAVAERVEVPNVVELPQDEAQERLEEVGLKLRSQDEAPSGEVAAGTVIEQDPSAEQRWIRPHRERGDQHGPASRAHPKGIALCYNNCYNNCYSDSFTGCGMACGRRNG